MKKVYYILIAAVVLVFASCKKYDDDIKRINDRLNRIEGTYISNIDKQIVGINSSLTDLSAVDVAMQKSIDALTAKSNELSDELKNNATADVATKTALEKEIADLNALIAALQASDASLDGKITALQTYVGSELSATEDWATATFATLEQYSSLQTELAAIKALVGNGSGNATIDDLTQTINGAIAASEQTMKAWVNEQLAAGYYDIATIDAKLSTLKGELADADSKLAKDIEAQRAALEQAKSELTAAYKNAITDAIETNNGLFNSTIAEAVQDVEDKINVRLALIENTIASIQNEINTINSSIATIEQQIVGIVSSLSDLSAVDSALQKSVDALTAKSNELSEELKNNATADAATKTALEKEISDLNTLISALQASNDSLDGKITALQTYVGSGLSATEDWATATFATLEQYASLQTELAAIKLLVGNGSGNTSVDELTQAINGAIVASEQSMKAWVNEQLATGYYDIATIDAKLSALKGELTSSDSELAKDIEAQRAALEQAKSELTAAYKSAIADAIETNNGLLNSTIATAVQTAIDKVNTKLAVIDNALAAIQQEIENIKNSIAGIQDQITAINGSLANLESVDAVLQKTVADLSAKSNELSEELKNNAAADAATKTTLEKEIADLNAFIDALQASDASLDGKITALQTYVGSELSATEDWATATFATLEQYASLQTELAAIKVLVGNGSGNTNIEELTQAINGAIAASEQSMKAWVNEQLAAGYYDIATIDAKLSALAGELTSSDSELSKDIEAQRAALEQAKSELTASYKSAISDAIETNNGLLNSTIAAAVQTAIDKVDTKLAVIDNALAAIQQEIENIKNSIAGIQDQITAINGSLANLESVDAVLQKTVADLSAKSNELSEELKNNAAADAATKTALEKEIADLNAFIDALQAGNALLDGKITALQTYVGSELSATEDWATATFATLEQYASLQTELAAIKALVGNSSGNVTVDELTQEINGAIAASEQSMKAWVNEQLATGYYDIATIDAKLSALAGELTSSDSELAKDIEAQRAALEQAKSELTAAYKSAISDAIETNNGLLNSTIATAVQTALGNVDTKLTGINSALADIQLQINKIANRIQSLTYIPQYADGKIKIDYTSKTTELYLRISPAALATSIEKSMVKAFARYTDDPRTRALNEEFNVNVTQVSGNASSGILHICLAEDASNKFSKSFWDGYVEAIIYIQISDGNNDIVSQAVPVVGSSIEPKVDVVTVNGVSFRMIQVKGGTFDMGSTSGYNDEKPVHSVTLSDYAIGETEVTQELWEAVMGTNPSEFKGDKKPVERVSWDDCQAFITKLNQLTGGKFRLPTEAEWEFAARGGVESKGYTYSGSDAIDDVAWYTGNSGKTTHYVATKAPNELGIYDMSGNVLECCQDWYSLSYYSSSPVNNPMGPSTGSYRVYRGASWNGTATHCISSSRFSYSPSLRYNYLGLRLAYGDLAEPNNPDIIDYSTQPFTITNTGTGVLTVKHNDNTYNINPNESVQIKQVADKAGSIEQVTNVPFTVSGNIMSLIYGDDFVGKTDLSGKTSAFDRLFSGCTKLTDASNLVLPATTLADSCYKSMFDGCRLLTQAPALPATTLASNCYTRMFSGCISLTEAPALPATTLAKSCYSSMFSFCSSLVEAPALPATTLAESCYNYMFSGCSSLVEAPVLPATTLASNCYIFMFSGCSSLVEAPALPATTLAAYCYTCMFSSCSSLVEAPVLPATTLASNCYYCMFSGCSSLVEAPALPATTLAGFCYREMFADCSSLTEAPALPATTLASFCYKGMFDGCISLTEAPALPATTLAGCCYDSMFKGCTSLTQSPALPATTLVLGCYEEMFAGCEKLNYIKMLATDISATDCLSTWTDGVSKTGTFVKASGAVIPSGTSGIPEGWTVSEPTPDIIDYSTQPFTITNTGTGVLTIKHNDNTYNINPNESVQIKQVADIAGPIMPETNIPFTVSGNIMSLIYGDDFVGKTDLSGKSFAFASLFRNCTKLTDASNLVLPATTLVAYCYEGMFSGCSSLTEAPALPATTLVGYCYHSMFSGCSSLTQAPELPAITLDQGCYNSMFSGCSSLTEAPALPATTLAEQCYYAMFSYCSSLTEAPALPATTLAGRCYFEMFNGCEKLNYIKMLATDISATLCLISWTYGVSKTGTFVKASGVEIPSGTSGIPSGWTVSEPTPEPAENVVTVNGVSFRMIDVKGGTFNMGNTSGDEGEQPVHSVTLSDFAIGETEVTQDLWQAVMGTNPSYFNAFQKPVERVSWDDCQTFITKLNELTGGKFRLPTEAEWEFAARGGVKSKGYTYSGSNVIDDVAWYYSNSTRMTHKVATKAPNELGIYDMSGNVREWCQDWYSKSYYSSSPVNNPTGPSSGFGRVLRGGYWRSTDAYCRSFERASSGPSDSENDTGLRLAL